MHANRAIYSNGWMAAQRSGLLPWPPPDSTRPPAWELYDLARDYSEAHDVAAQYPEAGQLKKRVRREAERNNVLPIDARFVGRQHPNPPPPGGRPFYTFYPGATHLFDADAPATRNRSHTFTAYVDVPAGGAEGVLVAEGGTASGYALYVKDGRPAYTYNYFRREVTTIAAPTAARGQGDDRWCSSPTKAAAKAERARSSRSA